MVHRQQVWKEIIHPLATVIGAWGGFPEPPKFFKRLARNELFQYFLVFALVYQGGGGEDIATSLMVTVGLYLMTKILNLRTLVGDLEDQAHAMVKPAPPVQPVVLPPPTAAPPAAGVPAPPMQPSGGEGFYGGYW